MDRIKPILLKSLAFKLCNFPPQQMALWRCTLNTIVSLQHLSPEFVYSYVACIITLVSYGVQLYRFDIFLHRGMITLKKAHSAVDCDFLLAT